MYIFLLSIWLFYAVFRVYEDYRLEAERLRIELFPITRGIILTHGKETIVSARKKNKPETTKYVLSCTYHYNWQGKNYYGETIRPRLKAIQTIEEADDLYTQLQPDRVIKVFVNPGNPAEAYLSPGQAIFSWGYTIGALLFGFLLPLAVAYCLYHWNNFHHLEEALNFITQ